MMERRETNTSEEHTNRNGYFRPDALAYDAWQSERPRHRLGQTMTASRITGSE